MEINDTILYKISMFGIHTRMFTQFSSLSEWTISTTVYEKLLNLYKCVPLLHYLISNTPLYQSHSIVYLNFLNDSDHCTTALILSSRYSHISIFRCDFAIHHNLTPPTTLTIRAENWDKLSLKWLAGLEAKSPFTSKAKVVEVSFEFQPPQFNPQMAYK